MDGVISMCVCCTVAEDAAIISLGGLRIVVGTGGARYLQSTFRTIRLSLHRLDGCTYLR